MDAEQIRRKIEHVADAMMRQDMDAMMAHFADDAVAVAPIARWIGKPTIYAAWYAYNQEYTNIIIKIDQVIAAGNKGVVEWSFAETRKSDGFTRLMQDAVVFELRDDQFVYWREYFDPLQEREL